MLKGRGTFWSVHFFCLLLQPFHIIYNMVETLVVSLVCQFSHHCSGYVAAVSQGAVAQERDVFVAAYP